jgi:hypothetical protein
MRKDERPPPDVTSNATIGNRNGLHFCLCWYPIRGRRAVIRRTLERAESESKVTCTLEPCITTNKNAKQTGKQKQIAFLLSL